MGTLSTLSGRVCALSGLVTLTLLAYVRVWALGWVYDDANWLPVMAMPTVGLMPFAFAGWLSGGLPWATHGLIVALHLLNGALFYLLIRRWLRPDGAVVALMLCWLHPIQVEAVAYASGGLEVLLTTYILIGALGLLAGSWRGTVIGLASLALAVPLKASALPAVIAVVAYAAWISRWRRVALIGAVAAGAWLVAPIAFRFGSSATPLIDRWLALSDVAVAGWRYLLFVIWPFGFSIEHDWLAVSDWVRVIAVVAASVASVAAAVCAKRWLAPWAACLWIGAVLVPRALVPHAPPLTEHHTYLPFLAVWTLAGASVDRFSIRSVA